MKIEYLRDHPELIPTVAAWIYREFPHTFAGESLEGWTEAVARGQHDGSITTLVGLEDGKPLATASFDTEDFPPRPELSPWLASVYTQPEYRGRGLAGLLLARVEQEAVGRGFARLYLHTTDQEGFYTKLGWRVLERVWYWDQENVVMTKTL